jgi:RNA polymerase sigma factor (sigma-70 family)
VDWPEIYAGLRANRNDPLAWSALEARVRAWARPALGSHGPDLVEDAVADACTRAVLDLAAARGPDTFRGFVKGKFLNARKAAIAWVHQPVIRLDDALEPAAPDDDAGLGATARLYEALDRCMETLPPRDRRAVELRYYEDAHAAAIARELDVTEGNARRIVFNGLNRLRRCAHGYGAAPAGGGTLART